jgi:hypothetical protein
MQQCQQTVNQSVYQHGLSVYEHTIKLISLLQTNIQSNEFRLPDWFFQYREQILKSLVSEEIIKEYTIHHDCGKPYCLQIDEHGKRHFPNHSETSYQTWLSVQGNDQAAKLMKMDMIIHTMKANDIDDFVKHPEAITLLIVGLAEVHSNAKMFGGIESDSFKIKWGQINKRGKAICKKLFGEI